MSGRPRKQLPMSDEEIRREYRLAKDPDKQIKILADENDCSTREIRDILRAGGLGVRGRPPKTAAAVGAEDGNAPHQSPAATASPLGKPGDGEPPTWPPLPAAPEGTGEWPEDEAAASESAEKEGGKVNLEGFVPIQELAAGTASPAGAGTEPAEDQAEQGPAPDAAAAPPQARYDPGESESLGNHAATRLHWISGKDLSRMWHILGRLQGVLEASAEAGKPGEVMRDACDELESLLCFINTTVFDP